MEVESWIDGMIYIDIFAEYCLSLGKNEIHFVHLPRCIEINTTDAT